MDGGHLASEADTELPYRELTDVLAEAHPAECRRLRAACDEQGLDPQEAVLVDAAAYLKHQEFLAEAAEFCSKYLRQHCDYAPADVERMDAQELVRAVKAEVGGE